MKIAIYSDPVMGKGGGSKVTIQLANALNADLITAGIDKSALEKLNKNIKVIDLGNATIRKNHPFGFLFEAPVRFLLCKNYKYDVKIFIGTSSIFASKKGEKNIWFSLTPNRIMYDLRKWKLDNTSLIKRLALKAHILLFNKLDQNVVRNNFIVIVAQTKLVKARIKKYYSVDSKVIYSPVDTKKYRFKRIGDFFLSVSRLQPEKRMTLIARAFTGQKDKKLVLVGNGPEVNEIRRIIRGSRNVKLLTSVNDKELTNLYATCMATIYMPINEDFGLVPVESMASGKVCIAADEGGCRETVLEGKTGYLIKPTIEDIRRAVSIFSKKDGLKMKNDCIVHASHFDIDVCLNKWLKVISTLAI